MSKDATALLLLLFVIVLAMLGLWMWVSGSSRRAALAVRGRGADDEVGVARLRHALDGRLRRSRQGRRLTAWLQSAGSPVAPADFVLLFVAGTFAAWVVCGLFVGRGLALVVALGIATGVARALVER